MAHVDSSPRFQDFDDISVYKHYEAAFLKAETLNMVIEFDSAKARAALDVKDFFGMEKILDLKVRKSSR